MLNDITVLALIYMFEKKKLEIWAQLTKQLGL